MPARVGQAPLERNCKTASDLEDRRRMLQAVRESALDGAVRRIARATHVSESAVYKVVEGEMRSPVEHLCQWMDAALEQHAKGRALAPLYYLIDRYLTRDDLTTLAGRRDVVQTGADALQSASEAVARAMAAVEDGEVTDSELADVDNALVRLNRHAAKLRLHLERANRGLVQ